MKLDPRSPLDGMAGHQQDQLRRFESFLRDRATQLGLLGSEDRDRVWERHVLDSLRALACLPERPVRIVDVGSGAGLPGIPLAIARPDCSVILLEARSRGAAFLELVVEELGLGNGRVVKARAEETELRADVAVARALADPIRTWRMCSPLTGGGGFVLYFGGTSWRNGRSRALGEGKVKHEICLHPLFPWQGPIIKMMRMQEPPTGA